MEGPTARQQPTTMITPPGAQVQQHDTKGLDILELVLQQLCLNFTIDIAVLSKLLCCSQATAALVHQQSAGSTALHLSPPYTANRQQLCTWLAKHARLLRTLHMGVFQTDMVEYVAAGLRAAAGAPSMCPSAAVAADVVTTSLRKTIHSLMQAEGTAQQAVMAVQCAALAAPQSDGTHSRQEQQQPRGSVSMLPLQELQLGGVLAGTLLHTISACCGQLTQLHLANVWQQYALADIRPLHKLQVLKVTSDQFWWPDNLQAMGSLSQLTKLESPILGPGAFRHLPVSLIELSAADFEYTELFWMLELGGSGQSESESPVAELQHLTRLTRLQLGAVQDPQLLPAQLRELQVEQFTWHEEFLQLQQLKSFQFSIDISWGVPDISPLTRWTQLSALRLRTYRSTSESLGPGDLSAVYPQLPKLPLVQLQCNLDLGKEGTEYVCQCTQLTELSLTEVTVVLGAGAFGRQLLQLQRLERLSLSSVCFRPPSFRPYIRLDFDKQHLIDAIRKLCGGTLRCLRLWSMSLDEQHWAALVSVLGSSLDCYDIWLNPDSPRTSSECEPLDEFP